MSDHGHGNGGKQRWWNCLVGQFSWVNKRWLIVNLFTHCIDDYSAQAYFYLFLNDKESHYK